MDKLRLWKIRSLECFCSEIPAAKRRKSETPRRKPGVNREQENALKGRKEGSGTEAYFVFSRAARPTIQWSLALLTRSLSDTGVTVPSSCSIRPIHQKSRPHHRYSQLRPGSLLRNPGITFGPRIRENRKFHISGDSRTLWS